jgi:predicted nucleotidyltransferase
LTTKLAGKNQVNEFRQIAERLVSRIASFEDVVSIVFMGGLTRGFMDKYSDIDIMVFLNNEDRVLARRIKKIGSDAQRLTGVDVDLEVHPLGWLKRRWNEVDRWSFAKSEIVYDPKGETRELFEDKLKLSDEFWVRRIVVCCEYLKWYCCPPKENMGTMAEAWVERGDLVSAHYCLTYSIDVMLRIIFALNKEFVPPQKWTVFYSYGLKWLPKHYKELLLEAMAIKEMSESDLERRLRAIRKMWRDIVPKVKDATGLTLDMTSKYYVEEVLHQK